MVEGTPHYQVESNVDSTYVTVSAGERELHHFKTRDLKDYKELFGVTCKQISGISKPSPQQSHEEFQ